MKIHCATCAKFDAFISASLMIGECMENGALVHKDDRCQNWELHDECFQYPKNQSRPVCHHEAAETKVLQIEEAPFI